VKLSLILLLLIFVLKTPLAQSLIPFGDVRIGEAPIPLDLEDFNPYATKPLKGLQLEFEKQSVQWIRDSSNLLIPRARLKITLPKTIGPPLFYYLGEVFSGEFISDKLTYEIDLWINLFNPGSITIKTNNEILSKVVIGRKTSQKSIPSKLIDYSCAPYDLEFTGLEDQYMSVGCRLEQIGPSHQKKPRLIVTWSASNALLADGTLPPYRTILRGGNVAPIEVINNLGQKLNVTIKASLPKRIHRLKTAIGFGPYRFETQSGEQKREEKWAPAFMFYGKYDFLATTSLRFFNATVSRGSLFNNGGVYLAYEIANLFDGRVQVIPLLGAQILNFNYNKDVPNRNKVIYPQGFEAVWRHSFGIKNSHLIYGMFISGSNTEPYKNLWLRWGTKIFGELNYIEWKAGTQRVKTYGVSIGLPFLSFL